jgi:hypothetical protein
MTKTMMLFKDGDEDILDDDWSYYYHHWN